MDIYIGKTNPSIDNQPTGL